MRYIFVSGGVVSGLGKGITSASLGLLLSSRGYKVTNVKVDMYLNIDAGTIRPQEHGEVFVTQDGLETDQDLGNYERFLNTSLKRANYITTGQIYKTVIDRERAFGYEGEDVEAIPHVTDEIINRFYQAGKDTASEIVIIELGGTVGEYQNGLFFEANRILKLRQPKDVIHIHVSYLPFLKNIGELKSKPVQQSAQLLYGMGIQPDFVIARSEQPIDDKRREKLAVFCNLKQTDIIGNPDLDNIYQVPNYLDKQGFTDKVIQKLKLKTKKSTPQLTNWKKYVTKCQNAKEELSIAVVGKYFQTGDYKLTDSYISVIEAVKQATWSQDLKPKLTWINSNEYDHKPIDLSGFAGVIVPQGWGTRGAEGKINAIKEAREQKIPYLGLCFGMQMAVIEFARNVCGLKNANSFEVNPKTPYPVIHIMPDQAKLLAEKQYGGTIRLGSWPCLLKKGTKLYEAYQKYGQKDAPYFTDCNLNLSSKSFHLKPDLIQERHRHRYEFNNDYCEQLKKAGLIISGTSPDGKLVEAIELNDHPFFVGTQFHPEYIARPLSPHPLFMAFISACSKK